MSLKMWVYKSILFLQLLGFASYGQSNNKDNCNLYIESIESNDTLVLKFTKWHHERLEDLEKISIYYENNELVANLNWRFVLSDEVIYDTIIKLNQAQIGKIRTIEKAIRNQNLEGNQLNFAGSSFKYELTFKEGKILYSTMNTYYRLSDDLLK
jgi:hypothetical protein